MVLVRGEFGSLTRGELGVAVNGTPALVWQRAVCRPRRGGAGTQTLTAILRGAGAALGQDAISVQVVPIPAQEDTAHRVASLGALPSRDAARGAQGGADYQWDADGDGVVDRPEPRSIKSTCNT